MLNPRKMARHSLPAIVGALVAVLLSWGSPRAALAQGTTTGGPTLGPTSFKYPERFDSKGNDLNTIGSRPQNLTPLGISYQDCLDDQQLRFEVTVSGFHGQDIQVWASKNGDCTQDSNRGSGGIPSCWQLPKSMSAVNQATATTYPFLLRVQDIIGPQQNPPNPPVVVNETSAACSTQPSYTSETFTVYFIPITNGNNATGTAYKYQLPVDLVGPPAPGGVTHGVGHTLFVMNWTPNADTDTGGYDLYIDPIPGQENADASTNEAGLPPPILECPDTGTPVQTTQDAGDAAVDSSAFNAAEAGCQWVYVGGSNAMSACTDSVLASSVTQDSGTSVVVEESGTGEGGTTTVVEGSGGISTIPSTHLVGTGGGGLTVSDKSSGSYTIKGLTDGVTYTVVVSAVDLFGNIGPPSSEQCDYPAPVNDFWQDYRNDGGGAGGFCSLDAVGATSTTSLAGIVFAVGTAGIVRRLRRRRTS
jgi:hypothetical protein